MKTTRTPREIVDHQVQKWAKERKQHIARGQPQELRPIITVSRQYGALGAHLGRLVAERLGYECWDQEILHEIARHGKAPKAMFESLDERKRNAVASVIAVFGETHHVTAGDYLRQLLRVLHTIATHGKAVIVGRGAQYVLDSTAALRVRTISPLEDRVAGLVKRKGISEEEARERCERIDRERRDFIRTHYDRDIEDPSGYDLLINTGTSSLDVAADVVITAYRSRFDLAE